MTVNAKRRRGRKPGPKTPWPHRARYLKGRCVERLKPNQVEAIKAADGFANWQGFPLNTFVTISFTSGEDESVTFRAGQDHLSRFLLRMGWELRWVYVWEAKGGLHVHALMSCPPRAREAVYGAMRAAFGGCDVHLRQRHSRSLSYMLKGTDVVTHAKAFGRRGGSAKEQGVVPWKRCGCTQNIGRAARERVENLHSNCAETSPRRLAASER